MGFFSEFSKALNGGGAPGDVFPLRRDALS